MVCSFISFVFFYANKHQDTKFLSNLPNCFCQPFRTNPVLHNKQKHLASMEWRLFFMSEFLQKQDFWSHFMDGLRFFPVSSIHTEPLLHHNKLCSQSNSLSKTHLSDMFWDVPVVATTLKHFQPKNDWKSSGLIRNKWMAAVEDSITQTSTRVPTPFLWCCGQIPNEYKLGQCSENQENFISSPQLLKGPQSTEIKHQPATAGVTEDDHSLTKSWPVNYLFMSLMRKN